MRSTAQADRGSGLRVLEPAHVVDPRPGRVHDVPRVDGHVPPVHAHLGPDEAAVELPEGDDLGAVQHARAGIRGGADVREAEASVVRRRVRIERARTKALGPQLRDQLPCAVGTDEPVEP